MPFTMRTSRRYPVQGAVTYHAGLTTGGRSPCVAGDPLDDNRLRAGLHPHTASQKRNE